MKIKKLPKHPAAFPFPLTYFNKFTFNHYFLWNYYVVDDMDDTIGSVEIQHIGV